MILQINKEGTDSKFVLYKIVVTILNVENCIFVSIHVWYQEMRRMNKVTKLSSDHSNEFPQAVSMNFLRP
jgi:hypothetical protein